MATLKDVLAAMAHVRDCTNDPLAWRAGLSPDEVNIVLVPLQGFAATPAQLDAILATIRRRHPALFSPTTDPPVVPPRPITPEQTQAGVAVEAMKDAEAVLAKQNSAASEFDRLMLEAVWTAHQTTEDGQRKLAELEADLEAAVRSRKLDTPLGARDFQRYLISRLNDILAVVAEANDSDASHRALLAALAALYVPDAAGDPSLPPLTVGRVDAAAESPGVDAAPYLDALPDAEAGADDAVAAPPAQPAPTPAAPVVPSLGGVPGGGLPLGLPFAGPPAGTGPYREPADLDEAPFTPEADLVDDDEAAAVEPEDGLTEPDAAPAESTAGATTVVLPNGETVTAASPQLAAVIKSAAEGTPIADAFGQQGITIPPPGTTIAEPLDPAQVIAGDIGMFTDRHALAIGTDKALLDGQIQHIANVSGPSFLGWQHPPAPATTAPPMTEPAVPEAPAPTRPSATATA